MTIKMFLKPKNIKSLPTFYVNLLLETQYQVVEETCHQLGWKIKNQKQSMNWDLLWTDKPVQTDLLGKMQQHQKINHFPGMFSLARKNYLARGICRMRKVFEKQYSFSPITWIIPAQISDLKANMDSAAKGKVRTYIVKPAVGSQGKGIFLIRNIDKIDLSQSYVVQRYLSKPYLIDQLKFDLRIYVLLVGCDPLRIYIYKQGLGRLSTIPYQQPKQDNMNNFCMHLTNYSINKDSDDFNPNQHKRTLSSVFRKLQSDGINIQQLWTQIKDIVTKTLIVGQPVLSQHYKACQSVNLANNMCFQILGFDIILDKKARPFLLEVNSGPSLHTYTAVDCTVKQALLKDTLKLLNISVKTRKTTIQKMKKDIQERMKLKKKIKISLQERRQQIEKLQMQRNQYQQANLGSYQLVYPESKQQVQAYSKFHSMSNKIYQQSTGANIIRSVKINQISKTNASQKKNNNFTVQTDKKKVNNFMQQIEHKRLKNFMSQSQKKQTIVNQNLSLIFQKSKPNNNNPKRNYLRKQNRQSISVLSNVRLQKDMEQNKVIKKQKSESKKGVYLQPILFALPQNRNANYKFELLKRRRRLF